MKIHPVMTVIISVTLLSACSLHSVVRPDGIERYETAYVEVSSQVPDSADLARQLSALILTGLEQRHVYRNLNHAGSDPAASVLLIQVSIVDIHRTTASRLIALGKSERSNEVSVEIRLSDRASGDRLTVFRLSGESPRRHGLAVEWPWGSLEQAMQRLSVKLATQLEEWSK